MAIINSYPSITPTAEDLLLVSDTSVEGNPTKTTSINSVLALIPSGSGSGGAGGTGSATPRTGANGGSGIVIIRYKFQ